MADILTRLDADLAVIRGAGMAGVPVLDRYALMHFLER